MALVYKASHSLANTDCFTMYHGKNPVRVQKNSESKLFPNELFITTAVPRPR